MTEIYKYININIFVIIYGLALYSSQWCFTCYKRENAVEQTIELPYSFTAMTSYGDLPRS